MELVQPGAQISDLEAIQLLQDSWWVDCIEEGVPVYVPHDMWFLEDILGWWINPHTGQSETWEELAKGTAEVARLVLEQEDD